jgi:hypothetical protein
MELPEIVKVEAHDLQPGDIVVVSTEKMLSREQAAHIVDLLAQRLPKQQVILLDGGLMLQVYREKHAESGAR